MGGIFNINMNFCGGGLALGRINRFELWSLISYEI